MQRLIKYIDRIIYWSIIMLPFSIAVAPAPMNVFMGFLIAGFLTKKIIKKEKIFTKNAINIPLLLLFIITCLSVINSVNYSDSLKGGIFRLLRYIIIISAVSSQIKDKAHIKKIIVSVCCGIIFVSLDAIFQELSGRDFVRGYVPMMSFDLARATASFKDPNTFGIYLSSIVPLICGLTLYYFKGVKKIIFSVITLTGLVAALLTYSRPTLLAIYVSLFILGWVKRNRALIGFLIIGLLIAPFVTPKSVKDWARQVQYNPLRFMCNDDRIAVYRNSLNMIKAHPIIGVGANTFMKNYKEYKESPEYRNVVTADYLYAHNNFLHMAAEIGLMGLGIFIWLLYKLFKECVNIYKHLDEGFLKIVSLSLTGCLIAFLVNGLMESSLYSSRVAMIFWYIMGFSLALNKFTPQCK